MTELLSKDHTILEKGMMEFRPFGVGFDGEKIRDASGVVVHANVDYLNELVSRSEGRQAGEHAVKELCRLLNERIRDHAYHVTPKFLENEWNSYSYEFVMFLAEFCEILSKDPQFQHHVGKEKFISPIIQILGRPFSLPQIYRMFPHFGEKFAKGSLQFEAGAVKDRSAVLRMKFTQRVAQQFGPYRNRCAENICQSSKAGLAAVPERVHHLKPATITDRTCMADGADFCEWEVTWSEEKRRVWPGLGWIGRSMRFSKLEEQPLARPEPPVVSGNRLAGSTGPMATQARSEAPTVLLSNDHRITEKGRMEFQPFGTEPDGTVIRDLSGVVIRADVEYLEDYVTQRKGAEAGRRAVEELVQRLNERISDPAYQVTQKFLRNPWNSYSAEFAAFIAEACIAISGDSQFLFNMARRKAISPIITTLGRPFSVPQIYKMSAYFAQRYAKDSFYTEAVQVSRTSATIQMRFSERTLRQFGPYRRACAEHWCNAHRGYFVGVPKMFHGLPEATVIDRRCLAKGDEYCEWEVAWSAKERRWWPAIQWGARHQFGKEIEQRQQIIDQQAKSLDEWFEELRSAYAQQQQLSAELQRRVDQLTTLRETGLLFTSTLDREALIATVLQTIVEKLHYDRAMLTLYDRTRQVSYDARIMGVSDEVAAYARSLELPVTDPHTVEGTVLLKGEPILVSDIQQVWDRLHPLNQQLATMAKVKGLISVPLKVKNEILGSLTVDRTREAPLTQDDLSLLGTMASEVAIALDNTNAYRQIEELNVGLEAKVRERTVELERLNRELKTVNDQLQELDRLKSDFFANISHDLRTPLTLSLGAFRTLLKLSATPEAKDLINSGLRNTSRLLFLINEFLDLAKFDSGLVELRKRCIDFAVLVRAVAANFESGERRRIHFRGTNAPVLLEADSRQMKKVLYNLLSNAFKFSDPDRGQVWIRLNSKEDWVELEVEDNGIGIPRDQLERIFDRFTQVEGSATRRYEGTGIGLALVKEIMASHGGKITVESELGRGSTFTIALPRGAATPDTIVAIEEDDSFMVPVSEERPPERTSPVVSSPAASGDRPLVLVADDNADMRAYLERLLNRQYRIVLAKDGVEGLEQAKTFRPDLIITDVMMPRMSGYDLLKAIRMDDTLRSIPVIILTARAGTDARVETWEAGADDYIEKPFDENEILARVNNLIRSRAQERELIKLREEKLTRFLPSQLAEMILAGRADEVLKSHRAEVTVVFIDLRGFTAFAEITEPETLVEVLREYQSEMGRLISDHHGVIERFSGDAMMIFFNDPVPVPNHAEQAVRMAIAMRNRIQQLRQEWSQRGIDLGAGIGIATGHATLGLIGFERRTDYAAIGAVTNLAARLCGQATHGQILISEQVMHFVKDLVQTEPVGALTLKGFHKPVLAYNVAGLVEQQPLRNREEMKMEKGG